MLTFRDASTTTSSIDLLLDKVAITPTQEGLALIPAGVFQMGDALLNGESYERPVHTVQVSAFRIGRYEVSKLLWDEVRTWGMDHGYADLPEGVGKAFNHPVHSVTWHAAVKWCNARSEKNGFAPAYRVGGSVYRTGEDDTVECDFQTNGYRLPTEAEWERAARGGLDGRRFPTGDTITHIHVNYYSIGSVAVAPGILERRSAVSLTATAGILIPPVTKEAFGSHAESLLDTAVQVSEAIAVLIGTSCRWRSMKKLTSE